MSLSIQQRLQALRDALLKLHKALIESERVAYEKENGAIRSPNHFLQLLTGDPWFAWLHAVSQLIVAMDEALDEKEPLTAERVNAFMDQSRDMLMNSDSGGEFSRHYFDAMQRDSGVVLAHAEAAKVFGTRKARARQDNESAAQ